MTSIRRERRRLAKVGLRLRRRDQAGFRFDYTTRRSVDEPAARVFVHITVTNPDVYDDNDEHARAVEDIGIDRFPNTGCSYNRLVMPDGTAYEGQPIGRRGAHTVNDYRRSTCTTSGCPGRGGPLTAPSWNLNVNARSYAICQNVGHPVRDEQLDSLARCIAADKLAGFVRRDAKIHGHRCVSGKSCPGDRMWERMHDLDVLVEQYVAAGHVGDRIGGTMSWDEDLSRGTSGTDISPLADKTLPKPAGRKAAQLLGYAASAFYWVRSPRLPRSVWRYRWPWRDWIKDENPDLVKAWPNGYTMKALLQNTFGIVRRMIRFEWWRDFVGRAIWSRQSGGDGDMHATRLARADRNSTKAVALAEANNALLAELIANQGGLTEARVRELFREAIEHSMIDVTVTVQGEQETAPPAEALTGTEDDA